MVAPALPGDVPEAAPGGVPAPVLVVPHRFRGPPASGNGGWVAGALAQFVSGASDGAAVASAAVASEAVASGASGGGAVASGAVAVRVRLMSPPPLDVPLRVEAAADGGAVRLLAPGEQPLVVAEASAVPPEEAHPYPTTEALVGADRFVSSDPFVSYPASVAAAAGYPGRDRHPFPSCFACSPAREPDDGLRLTPTRPAGGPEGLTATPWTPSATLDDGHGLVPAPVVWAALDCPGGWTVDIVGRPMVLGTMTAVVERRPAIGERCVVTGTARRQEGRKVFTTTTLWTAAGERLAAAASVWIRVDPAAIRPA